MLGEVVPSRRVPPPNLFTPDFGQAPHTLVGRDELCQRLLGGLRLGPADRHCTTLLLGPRGSGKTVLLNEIKNTLAAEGWIVISLDATTAGIRRRISEAIEWARDTHEQMEVSTKAQKQTKARINIPGLEWQRTLVQNLDPEWSLRRQLTALAIEAEAHDSSVLLAIDELHNCEREEARRLAADFQHIIKDEHRHLAFVGAGLARMKHTLMEDTRITFFQRCNTEEMPPITAIDAARFFASAITDAGGTIESEALRMMKDAVGRLPYRMQVIGDYAWRVSNAPVHTIDARAAAIAIEEAQLTVHRKVAVSAWHELSDSEQRYMEALAAAGNGTHANNIARVMAEDPRTLARIETHLANFGCIEVGDDDTIHFGDIINEESMRLLNRQRGRYDVTGTTHSGRTPNRPAACNEWMPRARAYCLLPRGHAGRHRSR
ncbi:ATP-binding protein [Candidatus Poriferisodalis sp.]|uniref:ATP-binding protein n=1 Tax=Candidatus Poriferisodalis sp. TaxID=3101277 RepID=UPI003B020A7F